VVEERKKTLLFLYLYIMKNIDDLIEEFNEGETDYVNRLFGEFETFFKFVDRRGKIDEIDIGQTPESEYWENELMLYFYEHHKDKFYHYCNKWLDDIEFEDGKVYCARNDASDFGILFCDNRDVSRSTIESILDGEADFDWYYDDDVDVFSGVIEDLTPKNLKLLQERFVIELSGVEVSPETNLLERIASEQGHYEYAIIDSSNIDEIFTDSKTVTYLLESELDDEITHDLRRVYSYASHSAIIDDYYNGVWGELTSEYFKGEPEWITRKHPIATNATVHIVRLEIFNFDNVINDFLIENKGYTGSSLLGYHGSFLEVLRDSVECLSVRFPDYADVTPELINDYFADTF
jgi:hypothetical protein